MLVQRGAMTVGVGVAIGLRAEIDGIGSAVRRASPPGPATATAEMVLEMVGIIVGRVPPLVAIATAEMVLETVGTAVVRTPPAIGTVDSGMAGDLEMVGIAVAIES